MKAYCSQIDELRKAGKNEKAAVLQRYQAETDFRLFLFYLLNPLFSCRLSEEMLRLQDGETYTEEMPLVFFETPFECCEFLGGLRSMDAATLRQVKLLLYGHCKDELERELLIGLFTHTLRLGVSIKTVNRVIPGLIPPWRIQLATPIESCPVEPGTSFWLTPIAGGRRATFYRGRLISGDGMPVTGLEKIENLLRGFCEENAAVLDGVLAGDCFRIFDIIPLTDFESANPKTPYSVRRMVLERAVAYLNTEFTSVVPLLYHGSDQRVIDRLMERLAESDIWGGLMLNLDTPYYRKAHPGCLSIRPKNKK